MGRIFSSYNKADIWNNHESYKGVSFMMSYTVDGLNSFDNVWTLAHRKIETLLKDWPYPIDRPESLPKEELEVWLRDNCIKSFYILPESLENDFCVIYINSVFFKNEADAMAFKLRWL